jgi:hypothetical protein
MNTDFAKYYHSESINCTCLSCFGEEGHNLHCSNKRAKRFNNGEGVIDINCYCNEKMEKFQQQWGYDPMKAEGSIKVPNGGVLVRRSGRINKLSSYIKYEN